MKRKDKGICGIPNCNQPAEIAGFCKNCYNWWNRIKYFDAPQLSKYLYRVERTYSRVSSRLSGKKIIRFPHKRRKAS